MCVCVSAWALSTQSISNDTMKDVSRWGVRARVRPHCLTFFDFNFLRWTKNPRRSTSALGVFCVTFILPHTICMCATPIMAILHLVYRTIISCRASRRWSIGIRFKCWQMSVTRLPYAEWTHCIQCASTSARLMDSTRILMFAGVRCAEHKINATCTIASLFIIDRLMTRPFCTDIRWKIARFCAFFLALNYQTQNIVSFTSRHFNWSILKDERVKQMATWKDRI